MAVDLNWRTYPHERNSKKKKDRKQEKKNQLYDFNFTNDFSSSIDSNWLPSTAGFFFSYLIYVKSFTSTSRLEIETKTWGWRSKKENKDVGPLGRLSVKGGEKRPKEEKKNSVMLAGDLAS